MKELNGSIGNDDIINIIICYISIIQSIISLR